MHIWNGLLGVVEVVDFDTGKILSRLAVGDDPVLALFDPAQLERPNVGRDLYMRLGRPRGGVVPGSDRWAYYVPTVQSGFLKRIDLSGQSPQIVRKGEEAYEDLDVRAAAASDRAGALCVKVKGKPDGATFEKSAVIRIFDTFNVKPQGEVSLSIGNCDRLETSRDGKYLYALDREQARIGVVEIATGREVKVLDNVGPVPVAVLALPETPSGE
ncbi:MAG: hypothetical protein HY000_34305 [Planctomycetes bacterium]|nr:hypothetical protein [Planctomycetota bacterium]